MNKAELIEALSERLGDRKTATSALDAVLAEIQAAVTKDDKVAITGFGVFERRVRGARTARNPRTGEAVKVKKTAVPAFRPGAGFKEMVASGKAPKNTAAAKKAATAAKTTRTTAAKATKTAAAKKTTAKKAAPSKTATAAAKKTAGAKKTTAAAAKATTAKKTAAAKKTTAAAKATTAKKTAAAKKAPAKKAPAKKSAARR